MQNGDFRGRIFRILTRRSSPRHNSSFAFKNAKRAIEIVLCLDRVIEPIDNECEADPEDESNHNGKQGVALRRRLHGTRRR